MCRAKKKPDRKNKWNVNKCELEVDFCLVEYLVFVKPKPVNQVQTLAKIASQVVLDTQCRVFKDDPILIDVISRECGWWVSSMP